MKPKEYTKLIKAFPNLKVMSPDPYPAAILAVHWIYGQPVAVYSREGIIKALAKDKAFKPRMTEDDAEDYCSFNIDGTNIGKKMPIILDEDSEEVFLQTIITNTKV